MTTMAIFLIWGHVSRREKGSERATEGQSRGGNNRTDRVGSGEREAPGSPRGAEGRVLQGDHRGSGRRLEGHGQGPDPRTAPDATSRIQVPAHNCQSRATYRAGRFQRAFPDTPTSRLKGPALQAFPTSRGRQERAGESAPVPTNLPSSSGNLRRPGKGFQVL